jgi:hypothetical protein
VGQLSPSVPIGSASVAVDSAPLPAVESITGESDIRQFLQSGVPTELVRAALRAAWTADASIRDFVGIAESQWDFNDPIAMSGFGPLAAMQSGAKSVVRQSISHFVSDPAAVQGKPELVSSQRHGQVDKVWLSAGGEAENPGSIEVPVPAPDLPEDSADSRPRLHGSALPQ